MRLELVSFVLCPFVQRAVIVLKEKGVAHSLTYVDLENPPDWFRTLSPFGKVPLLRVGEAVLFESVIINEYFDEVYPPPLHPTDPLERARHRGWVEFGSSLLVDQYELLTAKTAGRYGDKVEALRQKLGRFDPELDGEGPFFSGADFSLVDAAWAPLFLRHAIVEARRPELADLLPERSRRWSQALLARPSVSGSVVEDFRPRFVAHYRAKGGWLFNDAG